MGNNWLDHEAQRVVVNGFILLQTGGVSGVWRGGVGIKIWVAAVGHTEPFRAQLDKILLGI